MVVRLVFLHFSPHESEFRGMSPNRKGRYRPSSSIDFTGRDQERRDKLLDQWSYLNSPRGQPGEGRARNELHLSLQRLMAERDKHEESEVPKATPPRYGDSAYHNMTSMGRSGRDSERYFEPVDVNNRNEGDENDVENTRENWTGENSQLRTPSGQVLQKDMLEDYGVYGDEDEDDSYRDESHDQGHVMSKYSNEVEIVDVQYENGGVPDVERSRMRSMLSNFSARNESESSVPKRNESTKSDSQYEVEAHGGRGQFKPENLVPLRSNRSERRKLPSNIEAQQSMQRKEAESEENNRHSYVQAEKPSEDDVADDGISKVQSDGSKKDIVSSDSGSQSESKDVEILSQSSPSSSIQSRNSITLPAGPSGGATNLRTPKKLPTVQGRYSQPNLEQLYMASKIPSPPKSPTESNIKGLKMLAKDTKIPMYSPRKLDKGAKPQDSMSKSTEDMAKSKRKTAFGSIKSFFGRKR